MFPRPRLAEQRRIAECLEVYKLRIASEEAYRYKFVLQKRGLVHDLLTGRVRV